MKRLKYAFDWGRSSWWYFKGKRTLMQRIVLFCKVFYCWYKVPIMELDAKTYGFRNWREAV